MNRVELKFHELKKSEKKAFIPYVMGGYPHMEGMMELIELLADKGADMIEVGLPYSDPLADGPVIQGASIEALRKGFKIDKLFKSLGKLNIKVPIILMLYYNMLFKYGIKKFINNMAEAGCSGIIIPDLPPEEVEGITELAVDKNVAINLLIAPNSKKERIILAAEKSTGFLYGVSLKGVTGERNELPEGLEKYMERVKSITTKPVAVGFGISTPGQAEKVAKLADGVIVGSKLIKILKDYGINGCSDFAAEIRNNIK